MSSASPLDDDTTSRVKISHVCYDEYIDAARQRVSRARLKNGLSLGDEEKDERKGDTEDTREELSCTVDATTSEDSHDTNKSSLATESVAGRTDDGADWWHEGRRDAMAMIEALAAGRRTPAAINTRSTFDFVVEGERGVDGEEEEALLHVVLADDNMHFRSMRHEVLRVARSCEILFCSCYPSRLI